MQLSEHFSLAELTISAKAKELTLDNIPKGIQLENLKYTANKMEEIRNLLGHPIKVTSGYRSPAVNKAIGSKAKHSQHMEGQAVDFTCRGFGTPDDIVRAIKSSDIEYDQIIKEFDSWVHISFVKTNSRKQALVIDNSGTRFFA